MEGAPNNEESLVSELKDVLRAARKENMDVVLKKVVDETNRLKEKYPDYLECRMYHVLIGSSMDRPAKFFDFPGGDSIENFIRSL